MLLLIYNSLCYDMADWSKLPLGLAIKIAEKIDNYEDLVKGFCSVCKRWKPAADIAAGAFAPERSRQTPLLMFVEPIGVGDGLWRNCGRLYSLDKCGYAGHVDLPYQPSITLDDDDNSVNLTPLFIQEDWAYSSTRGWLVYINETLRDIVLTHPFSNETIQCPPLPYDLSQEIIAFKKPKSVLESVKFSLSDSPSNESEYSFAMICSGYHVVAVWRNTQNEWLVKRFSERIMDIIFYRGDFCHVNDEGKVFDFSSNKNITSESLWQPEDHRNDYINLVESDGNLLVVRRQHMDSCVTVWAVNVDGGRAKEVTDLGGNSIFVGDNSGFTTKTDNSFSIRPNSVYYVTDHCRGSTKHIMIYHLGSKMLFEFEDAIFTSSFTPNLIPTSLWIEATTTD